MFTTYAKKKAPVQNVPTPSASPVLDSSSQSDSLQRKADMANNATQRAEAPRPNNTGMPDNLKSGIESLSGFSMDDVRVHYNSSKPATVQALAYTQGTDIHVAPGQEKHLPHEAWHVAQQMAGRVSPTTNINGMPVNDNAGLEHEADVMGEKAVQMKAGGCDTVQRASIALKENNTFTRIIQKKVTAIQIFNLVIGEISKEIGETKGTGLILSILAKENTLNSENAEQNIIFRSAWNGNASDLLDPSTSKQMKENLIQSNVYGIGDKLKLARLDCDKEDIKKKSAEPKKPILDALASSLFFRADKPENVTNFKIIYNPNNTKGNGTAASKPGKDVKNVTDRAMNYIFTTKSKKEAQDYEKKTGGKTYVFLASKDDVNQMLYDVDSNGYKTKETITGIIGTLTDSSKEITESAFDNFITWLPTCSLEYSTKKEELSRILKNILESD